MEQDNNIVNLAKEIFSTNHNFEIPYILTKEDEERIIQYEVNRLREAFMWKRKSGWGVSLSEISLNAKMSSLEIEVEEIEWEKQINKDELFKKFNSNKYWADDEAKRKKEKDELEKEKRASIVEKCTYKYFYDLIRSKSREMGKEFIYNDDNSHYVKALCFFMSGNPKFEDELNLSFKRGLMVRGKFGVGKTHAVKCISDNPLHPIRMYSMIEISKEVDRNGEFIIKSGKDSVIYLDDVGTEEAVVNHYGTKINWFKDFIETYYANYNTYNKLIITTNCSFDELESRYGGRVRSRLAEMFNVIDVKGNDFRKL